MAKAGHIILGLGLPIISIIATVAEYNSKQKSFDHAFHEISAEEKSRQETYLLLKNQVDSIIAYKSIAKFADSLEAAAARMQATGVDVEKVKQDLDRILLDSLLAGNYKPLFGNERRMVLTPDGHTMGFRGFSEFKVESFFWPVPSQEGLDVISFTKYDGTSESYHWEFAGDTLVFTGISGNDEVPAPAATAYKFLNFKVAY